MERELFIQELRNVLNGKVPTTVIEENVAFYTEYIAQQVRQGKKEEQIIKELGSPRLIAKTIIEANKHAEERSYYEDDNPYVENEENQNRETKPFKDWYHELPQWVHRIFTILIVILVLYFVFSVIRAIFPILFVAFIIWGIIRIIQSWGA